MALAAFSARQGLFMCGRSQQNARLRACLRSTRAYAVSDTFYGR